MKTSSPYEGDTGTIVIVCAGKTGRDALHYFGESNVICFADNSKEKQGTQIMGKTVIAISDIKKITNNTHKLDIVIALTGRDNYLSSLFMIAQQLRNEKIENYSLWQDIKDIWATGGEFIARDRTIYPVARDSLLRPVEIYALKNDIKANEYEKKWQSIRAKYRKIKLYKLRVDVLGEYLQRYFAICEEDNNPETLKVLLPVLKYDFTRIANKAAIKYTGVCEPDDVLFWLYIIKKYPNDVDLSDIDKFIFRTGLPTYFFKAYSIIPHFTTEQIAFGEESMQNMGVTRKFVCMSIRDKQYNTNSRPGFNEERYHYRYTDFNDYNRTIKYLGDNQLLVVKMGRYENPIKPINNCVDYAGLYSNDFMDLYLFSKCEFAVTASNGITTLAWLFARPLLLVNMVPCSFGWGGARYTEYDMFIPKKYYIKNKKRYMTFLEMFELEKNSSNSAIQEQYDAYDVEVHNNTEDEILNATQELMARINGAWIDTEEDIKNLKKWQSIFEIMDHYQRWNEHNWTPLIPSGGIGGTTPLRPAATFLRKNKFMLE